MLLFLTGLGPAAAAPDYSSVRGANYVPSYARNDLQTWLDYDPAMVDRELGYAEKLGLNSVRVFLQVAVYEKDPKLFRERLDSFLALCDKHHLTMMPVLFDSCFGEFPDLAHYREKDWMACPGQNRLAAEHWPKLEQYVREVVGSHRDDARIAMWDVMNEPTCTSYNSPEDRKLIYAFLCHMLDYTHSVKPAQPLTAGLMNLAEATPEVLQRVDVLAFHSYTPGLREEIRRAKALGAEHGKPVIINEVVMRPAQPFSLAMPILREEEIGWYFWELMLGSTQFSRGDSPIQGIAYPDGTCRQAAEVAAVLGRPEAEARALFPERPKPKKTEDGVTYEGFWTRWTGKGPAGDRLFYANQAGCIATFAFTGTEVTLIHKVGPDCGVARIRVDGRPDDPPDLDTYAAQVEWNHRTVLAKGLAAGQHTATIEATGWRCAAASDAYVQIVGVR